MNKKERDRHSENGVTPTQSKSKCTMKKGVNEFLVWVRLLISDAVPECSGSQMYFSLRTVLKSGLEDHIRAQRQVFLCFRF